MRLQQVCHSLWKGDLIGRLELKIGWGHPDRLSIEADLVSSDNLNASLHLIDFRLSSVISTWRDLASDMFHSLEKQILLVFCVRNPNARGRYCSVC